jgi:hypothetical protein
VVGAGRIEGEKKDVEVGRLEGGDPPADLGRKSSFSRDKSFDLEEVKKNGQSGDPRQNDK